MFSWQSIEVKEEHTRLLIMKETGFSWYTSTSYDPLLSGTTAVFRDTSRFYQPGRSQSINHLPKLNSMFSSVLANRTTAIRLQLLKYDKNFFQTVVAVLWGLIDMSFTVFLLYESFRPISGHRLLLYQIANSPSWPSSIISSLIQEPLLEQSPSQLLEGTHFGCKTH